MERNVIYGAIDHELNRQVSKFGIDGTCANPAMDTALKLSILAEETGEVARVINDTAHALRGGNVNMPTVWQLIAELVQVAAVAVAWLESVDDPDA